MTKEELYIERMSNNQTDASEVGNSFDRQYLALLDQILTKGRRKQNRTGVETLSLFGTQMRINLKEGFPQTTLRKAPFKTFVTEILWFLSGNTNIKYLLDNNVSIWNDDCYRGYNETRNKWLQYYKNRPTEKNLLVATEKNLPELSKDDFISRIKNDGDWAKLYGDLGVGSYGWAWRHFGQENRCGGYCDDPVHDWMTEGVDQIQKVVDLLKNDPDSRRILINAYHPYFADHSVLNPCHVLIMFDTEELSIEERKELAKKALPILQLDFIFANSSETGWIEQCDKLNIPKRRLNCQYIMRSTDFLLGGNFINYSLLTHMLAQVCNMDVGELVFTSNNSHIYENQIPMAREMLARMPRGLPTLKLNPSVKNIFDFKLEDFEICGYNPHEAIKIPLSVG